MGLKLSEIRVLRKYLKNDSERLFSLHKNISANNNKHSKDFRDIELWKAEFYQDISEKLYKLENKIMLETEVNIIKLK